MSESVHEVQESIKIALDAADAATDITSEYNRIKREHSKLEKSVKNIHKYTTMIFGISIAAGVVAIGLTALIYSRSMSELSAMTNTSREALVVFAENVEKVSTALNRMEIAIQNQSELLETSRALTEALTKIDTNFTEGNKAMLSEMSVLSAEISKNLKNTGKQNTNSISKLVKELNASQSTMAKRIKEVTDKASGTKDLKQIIANQKTLGQSFNALAKAVTDLATQSGALAKSFKDSSYIKYP